MTSSATGNAGCADSAKFRALVDGSLSERDEQDLARHLDECEGCRARLDAQHSQDEFSDQIGIGLSTRQEIPGSLKQKLRELDSERTIVDSGLIAAEQSGSRPASRSHSKLSPRPYADVAPWLAEPTPDDEPATIGHVGEFQLLEFLGRGGMGVVFRARDTTLGRMVALKIMSPSLLADEDAGARFLREARSAAAINHPNVVTIHAVHDSAELPFLVMEFVEGESLQQRLRRLRRLNASELADIARQVASGLAAAHTAGVVHRDVKPANILIEAVTGRIVVSDFGLARATDSATLTSDGTVAGTLTFLAPERVNGQPADQHSDLFSLGSVLYAAASGVVPFDGDAVAATLHRISRVDLTPLSQLVPDAPGWIAELVGWLHQRRPADRPRSAAEVVSFVDQHAPGGASTGQPGMTTHIERATRRETAESPSETQIEPGVSGIDRSDSTQRLSESQTLATRNPIRWERWALVILVTAMLSFAAANWFGDDEEPQELSPEHPFLLLGQDEPEPFGSLEEAIRRADNGSTIELHTNDPIELSGFDLDRDIVIRAAPGMRPVLVFRPGPDGHDVLFATDSHLSLEGLEVHVEPRSEDERLTAIEIHGAELRIIHCQIMNPSGTGIVADEAQRIVIEDTEIQCPREAAIACDLAAGGQLEIRTSFLTGQDPLRMSVFADDVEVQLIDTALLGRHAVAVESEFDVDSDEARHVDFVAHRTAFLSAGEPLLLVAEEMPDGEAVAKVIEWEGRENTWQARGVVDDPAPMIGVDIEDDEFDIPDWSPETLEEWRELSSVTEEDSLWGDETRSAHFDEAFDLIERGDFIPRELMLRDHSCDE